jgi:peptidyl-tRNA hydrolase, PTH1 family
MLLVVGLGNPGSGYAKNRHNIGFMAADAIVRRHSFGRFRNKFHGEISEGSVAGRKVLVLKPKTYMNDSGRSVLAAATFHRVPTRNILVLHDELDLPGGRLRMKRGGGHGGHNGLRSIHAHLGPDFRRVRLGIGHPGDKDQVVRHVLKDFAKADQTWRDKILDAIAEHFPLLVRDNDSGFMNKVALVMQPPKPPKPKPEKPDSPTDEQTESINPPTEE